MKTRSFLAILILTNVIYFDVYFLEPETQTDRIRMVSIIKTDEKTGYYINVFRSSKQRKGNKFHDNFYHNLGQTMQVMNADGQQMELESSEEMGFAGGHLYALESMWDKKSIKANDDYQVKWKIDMPDGEEDIFMNFWMTGTDGRELFSIKSPPNKTFRENGSLPYEV